MSEPDTQVAPTLLAAEGLCFMRGDEPVFGPMSFSLKPGDVLMIEGENGSGKTSLLRVLAGLLEASAGSLLRSSGEPSRPGSTVYLGHSGGMKVDLSARENLRFSARMNGLRKGTSIASSLKSVGLEGFEDAPLRFLSAGQRKRAALAGVLLAPAALWLLDEPYANLDQNGQVLVDRLLETHSSRGGAALITSHGLTRPAVTRLSRMPMECSDA